MQIKNYEIINENIKISFNKNFKQIRYLKLCGDILNTSYGELECDEAEIKFTKEKSSLMIYNGNCQLIIFIIIEIDNQLCNYSYYININFEKQHIQKNNEDNKKEGGISNFDLIGLGISKLFLSNSSSSSQKNILEEKSEKEIILQFPIKNRKIFANIKRKDS